MTKRERVKNAILRSDGGEVLWQENFTATYEDIYKQSNPNKGLEKTKICRTINLSFFSCSTENSPRRYPVKPHDQ